MGILITTAITILRSFPLGYGLTFVIPDPRNTLAGIPVLPKKIFAEMKNQSYISV